MKTPSRTDWGSIDSEDLDAEWAFKQFYGKSFDEAEAMFQENALYYQEDLQSMPYIPFNFYAPALAKYLTSKRASCDADGASSFLQTRPEVISEKTREVFVSVSSNIARNQQYYDADVDIYGNFSDLYAQIQKLARDCA